jgi:3-isopropylmalate dehydrogenase
MTQTLLLLSGDGIGPEVLAEAKRIAEIVAPDLVFTESLVGGASYDAHGTPLTDETLAAAKASDAVLMGAVGGPKWDDVPRDKRPEMGLLNLRKGMDVFANLRPAFCFPSLVDASSLKPELVRGLDIMIVRELTSGVYFGEPRGTDHNTPTGEARGFDTSVYTISEIERVTEVAHKLAQGRSGRICSVDKANVMETGLFWRGVVDKWWLANDGGKVELSHMYADACAMELVRAPKQFDVILAGNLFGDILSDEAAMLTGSIGMLPSASLSIDGAPGLYEPVHGSAPDIAGKGIANPCAAVLSLEMALRWSLDRSDAADRVFAAVSKALEDGARTADLGGELSTQEMGEAVIAGL